jgi:hypothetical protein
MGVRSVRERVMMIHSQYANFVCVELKFRSFFFSSLQLALQLFVPATVVAKLVINGAQSAL